MTLSPAKSRHEGNWLHFTVHAGGGGLSVSEFTQFEKLDFTGKKVMAVMTHEGSGLATASGIFGKSAREQIAIHGEKLYVGEMYKICYYSIYNKLLTSNPYFMGREKHVKYCGL